MKLLTHYPLIGLALLILGGILLVWRSLRPKVHRPADAPTLQPLSALEVNEAIARLRPTQFEENAWDEPIKMELGERVERPNTSEYVKAVEAQSAVEVPGALVVTMERPAAKKRSHKKLKTKGK